MNKIHTFSIHQDDLKTVGTVILGLATFALLAFILL